MTYQEVIAKLRFTKSESKRILLDTAADMIEELLREQLERRKHTEDLSDGALE